MATVDADAELAGVLRELHRVATALDTVNDRREALLARRLELYRAARAHNAGWRQIARAASTARRNIGDVSVLHAVQRADEREAKAKTA